MEPVTALRIANAFGFSPARRSSLTTKTAAVSSGISHRRVDPVAPDQIHSEYRWCRHHWSRTKARKKQTRTIAVALRLILRNIGYSLSLWERVRVRACSLRVNTLICRAARLRFGAHHRSTISVSLARALLAHLSPLPKEEEAASLASLTPPPSRCLQQARLSSLNHPVSWRRQPAK